MALILNTNTAASFCLTLIVKNESHCITRLLDSCLPLLGRRQIDCVRVVDTGSTDDTIHKICEWGTDHQVDCQVVSRPWVDFATSRNEALAFAFESPSSHLLLLDADEILHITPNQTATLREKLSESKENLFSIPMLYGNNVCVRVNLVRNLPGRLEYLFPIHEEICLDGQLNLPATLIGDPNALSHGPYVSTPQDGARSLDPDKELKDIELLIKAWKETMNPRFVFFHAQLLRAEAHKTSAPEDWTAAREAYQNYLDLMVDRPRESYLYLAALWVARILEMEGGQFYKQVLTYLKVYEMDRTRPEALGSLMEMCVFVGRISMAKEFAAKIINLPQTANYCALETKWVRRAQEILAQYQGVH